MNNFDYEVFTAEKVAGLTAQALEKRWAPKFPESKLEAIDNGDHFLLVSSKLAADDEEDVVEDAPEFEDQMKDFSEGEEKEPKEPKEPKEEKEPKKPKKDDAKEGEGDEKSGDPLSQAQDLLEQLIKVLPKVKDLVGGGSPESDLHGEEMPDDVMGDIPPPPGGPKGKGPAAPSMGDVGPVPGGPPMGAGGPPVGGPRPPRPARGFDKRKSPPIGGPGLPTFAKSVYHPAYDDTGNVIPMSEVSNRLEANPRYARFEVGALVREGSRYRADLVTR